MGIVVDREEAEASGCTCYATVDSPCGDPKECPDEYLSFSEGVIGALSNAGDRKFCPSHVTKESQELSKRLGRFKQMGKINDVCLEKEEKDYLGCVIREAKRLKK